MERLRNHGSGVWFDVTTLARMLHMTRRNLHKLTMRHYGFSPHDLLETWRLEDAVQLMLIKHQLPCRVSRPACFRDTRTFYRVFRKRFGQSPALWLEDMMRIPVSDALRQADRTLRRPAVPSGPA